MQQTRAVIRLDSIRRNAAALRAKAPESKLCAVVKADAYGHGAAMVALALSKDADMFAVALVEEGARLRAAGIDKDILVLTPPLNEAEVLRAARYDLILTVADAEDYALAVRSSERFGLCVRCHLKSNTGMNRYGFDLHALSGFLCARLSDRVAVEGIYSHFYRPEDENTCSIQFRLFRKFCAEAERAFGSLVKHIAATGGVLASPQYCMDMIRVGIGLYGYLPAGFSRRQCEVRPALKVYATVAGGRPYRGGGAGYGAYAPRSQRLSVVRAGYADGLFRKGERGKNALCMDAYVAEREIKKYREVCVFSDADAYAARHGTISYEALVHIGARAVKEYVGE